MSDVREVRAGYDIILIQFTSSLSSLCNNSIERAPERSRALPQLHFPPTVQSQRNALYTTTTTINVKSPLQHFHSEHRQKPWRLKRPSKASTAHAPASATNTKSQSHSPTPNTRVNPTRMRTSSSTTAAQTVRKALLHLP